MTTGGTSAKKKGGWGGDKRVNIMMDIMDMTGIDGL